MSVSEKAAALKTRKEYVLAGPDGPFAEECIELRSDRFERKGLIRRNRSLSEDVVVAKGRGNDPQSTHVYRVMLDTIAFDHIRTYQNLEAYPYAFESDLDVLQWACALAGESPTLRILLREAQENGWSLALQDLGQGGYAVDEESRALLLDHYGFTAHALGRSAHFRNALFVSFAKALRELWHDRAGHDFTAQCRPDAVLMLERARAADCETIAILAGWELRASGHADIWRYILGSDEGDMAMIFTRAIEKDPAGFYDGSVLTRAFCQWYADESRVAAADHAALERLDEMLEEAQGAEIFGKEKLRAGDIEKMSQLPGGRAYLAGMGANICADPYFLAVNDPINEAHLFQIVYDSKVVMIEGVPFRDQRLARLIFPGAKVMARE